MDTDDFGEGDPSDVVDMDSLVSLLNRTQNIMDQLTCCDQVVVALKVSAAGTPTHPGFA